MPGFENNQSFLLPRRSVEAPPADKIVSAWGEGGWWGGGTMERENRKKALSFSLSHHTLHAFFIFMKIACFTLFAHSK